MFYKNFILLTSLISYATVFCSDPVVLDPSNKDHTALIQNLGRQLKRLSNKAYVISVTQDSNYTSPTQLEKSKERLSSLVPLLKAMGLKFYIVSAKTPKDVDLERWQQLEEIYSNEEEFFNQSNWPEEVDKKVGTKESVFWRRANNWGRKVPGTEVKDPISGEVTKPSQKILDPRRGIYQAACYLSHLEALRLASQHDENIIFLEDDANFVASKELIENFRSAIDDLENIPWDIFKIGASFYREESKAQQIGWHATDYLTKLTGSYGGYAQVISRHALPQFYEMLRNHLEEVKNSNKLAFEANDALESISEINGELLAYMPNPPLAGQGQDYSLIRLQPSSEFYYKNRGLLRQGIRYRYPAESYQKRAKNGVFEYVGSIPL